MKINQSDMFGNSKTVLRVNDFSQKTLVGRVLHLGAGVQSSTLAEMVVEGELEGLDLAIFCDTGDEPKWVYDEVNHLLPRLASVDVPLVVLKRSEGGIVEDTKSGHGRFASMPFYTKDPQTGRVGRLKRQCTNEYKIEVAEHYIREWLVDRGYGKVVQTKKGQRLNISNNVYVEQWFGLSWDEATTRLKDRSTSWGKDMYPLIDRRIDRDACRSWLVSKGLPVPGKSACRVCAFHGDDYWLDLKTNYPTDFEHACSFDDWIRSDEATHWYDVGMRSPVYLHKTCTPLREIDFNLLLTKPVPPMFCGAHCMT